MSLKNIKHRVLALKKECDSIWTMSSSHENPATVRSETYQQVLDIIDEECQGILDSGVELLKQVCGVIESRMIQVQTMAQLAEDKTQLNTLKVRLSELDFVHDVIDDFMKEAESGQAEQD